MTTVLSVQRIWMFARRLPYQFEIAVNELISFIQNKAREVGRMSTGEEGNLVSEIKFICSHV